MVRLAPLRHALTNVVIDSNCSEATPKAGAAIVQKTWAERLNDEPELESDADEQLLMYIPYVSSSFLSFFLFSPFAVHFYMAFLYCFALPR